MDNDAGTVFGNLDAAGQVDYINKTVMNDEPDTTDTTEDQTETEPQPQPQEPPAQDPAPAQTDEGGDEGTEGPDDAGGQTPQPQPQKELYTPDEYLAIEDPSRVDPERLPQDARFVHERDLKYFNERILPQVRAMNEELVELRNYRARVEAEKTAAVQTAQKGSDEIDFDAITPDQIAGYAQMETARLLGVAKIDTTDPKQMAALSYVTTDVTNRLAQAKAEAAAKKKEQAETAARQQQLNYQLGTLKQQLMQDPNFEAVDQFALESMKVLPYHVHQAIMQDLHSGDVQRITGVYQFFAQRWAQDQQARKKVEQTAKAATVKAPKLQGGSNARPSEKREFSMSSWSSGKAQDQTKMLIDSGLV